jgi:hypothetical protein
MHPDRISAATSSKGLSMNKQTLILIISALLLLGCGRQTEDVGPAPIAPGGSSPSMAFAGGVSDPTYILVGDAAVYPDTTNAVDEIAADTEFLDTTTEDTEEIAGTDTVECDESPEFCKCLEDFAQDVDYCTCKLKSGIDHSGDYECECCHISFDPSHPLYETWRTLVPDTCAVYDIYDLSNCP